MSGTVLMFHTWFQSGPPYECPWGGFRPYCFPLLYFLKGWGYFRHLIYCAEVFSFCSTSLPTASEGPLLNPSHSANAGISPPHQPKKGKSILKWEEKQSPEELKTTPPPYSALTIQVCTPH